MTYLLYYATIVNAKNKTERKGHHAHHWYGVAPFEKNPPPSHSYDKGDAEDDEKAVWLLRLGNRGNQTTSITNGLAAVFGHHAHTGRQPRIWLNTSTKPREVYAGLFSSVKT